MSLSLVKTACIILPKVALAKASHVTKTDSRGREVASISWGEDMQFHIIGVWLKRGGVCDFYNILYKDTTVGRIAIFVCYFRRWRNKIIQCCQGYGELNFNIFQTSLSLHLVSHFIFLWSFKYDLRNTLSSPWFLSS